MVARPLMSTEEMSRAAGSQSDQDASRSLHDEHDHGTVAYDDLTGDELKPSLMRVREHASGASTPVGAPT